MIIDTRSTSPLKTRHAFTSTRTSLLWIGCIVLAVYFALITSLTRSTFFGDTPDYVSDIQAVIEGHTSEVSLLDFGHLIWRPLGLAITPAPKVISGKQLNSRIATELIWLNIFASLACAVALWILMQSVEGMHPAAALLSGATMLTANGFIILSRAGTAWLPGLAFDLMACCLAIEASRRKSIAWACSAAVLAALAAVSWIPYVLAAPMVACAPLLLMGDRKTSYRDVLKSCLHILPLAGALTIAVYLAAVYARHITTPAEFMAWVRSAAHGEVRGHQLLRMFFGLPRSFLIAGDDGVLWKQYLFHDPYAQVHLADLLRASLWRVAAFGAAACTIIWELWRMARKQERTAQGVLLFLGIAAIPTLALAVLFEAGSVERYLALYGAFFIALAWVVSQKTTSRIAKAIVILFCCLVIGNNLYANWKPRVDDARARALSRLGVLQTTAAKPRGIFTINGRDELWDLYDPNDRSLDSLPRISAVIPLDAGDVSRWKFVLAKAALRDWSDGGEIWISKRCWANRPVRQWLWVEGDDQALRWKDLPQLFSRFKVDAETGGNDGFYRLANTPQNREIAFALTDNSKISALQ